MGLSGLHLWAITNHAHDFWASILQSSSTAITRVSIPEAHYPLAAWYQLADLVIRDSQSNQAGTSSESASVQPKLGYFSYNP